MVENHITRKTSTFPLSKIILQDRVKMTVVKIGKNELIRTK